MANKTRPVDIINAHCIVKFDQWGYHSQPFLTLSVYLVSCQYTILENEALLHIAGPDSLTFLQGQTTCDTRSVDASHAIPGAYCTPKGRVVCDFLLCQIAPDHFALRMRGDILDTSAAVFGKYIVFSKAELHPDNQDWKVFACWGKEAGTALCTALGVLPASQSELGEQYSSTCGDGFVLIQTDRDGTQFECYINTDSHPGLAEGLALAMSPGDVNSWLALQIEQGIGRIEAATVEMFIPQALNYDLTGHVNFKKGCYTGQEVVARMHYRGKPKKRLYQATTSDNIPLSAGSPLYNAESEQAAGTLVNSAPVADDRSVALIVAPVAKDQNIMHLGDPNGPALLFDLSADNTG